MSRPETYADPGVELRAALCGVCGWPRGVSRALNWEHCCFWVPGRNWSAGAVRATVVI